MDNVPLVLQIVHRDDKGNGMVLSKEFGAAYVTLEKIDPVQQRTIRLNFYQLLEMMKDLEIAERKEKNQRVLLGIDD